MKALIQRVANANVVVEDKVVGEIGEGLVVLLGIKDGDSEKDIDYLVNKIVNLRIFPKDKGHFEASMLEESKEALVVSQFTLYGSCKKGRRPDFVAAAKPEIAEGLYELFIEKMRETGVKTATGKFQAMMDVNFTNSGPVTFMLES